MQADAFIELKTGWVLRGCSPESAVFRLESFVTAWERSRRAKFVGRDEEGAARREAF